jgi:cytoskeletal protein CcmA (bactofilin family)
MGTFDDANVDKDLLSQIFADEGDDAETDALLDEMLKDVENEASKKEEQNPSELGDTVQEEQAETKAAQETAVEEPAAEEEPKAAAPEEKKEEPAMPVFETNTENDSVRKEAKEVMDAERHNGTVTTITSGTTIKGGIASDGSLEVMGVITGDVECQGKLSIIGKVSGNVIASEIYVSTQRLEGSLSSEGAVKIGVGTIIVGDVDATSAYIAGAVKGDIDVNGHVVVDSTAIIKGNIKAKSVQVNNGAVVDGYCSLNYAGVDLDDFFEGK